MEACKVKFICDNGQKIVVNFTLDDKSNLDYKLSFEPKVDMKTDLGLGGQLCEVLLTALSSMNDQEEEVSTKKNLVS